MTPRAAPRTTPRVAVHPAPSPQRLVVGLFLALLAVVVAVAPLPLLPRSLGILASCYAALAFGGLPFAFVAALLAPVAGLLTGGPDWLVIMPLLLSSGLLGFLGLDYAWRYPAVIVSPLLYVAPQVIAWWLSQRDLFAIALPWSPSAPVWLGLHALVALVGTVFAVGLDHLRERSVPRGEQR
jgi:hypothetical protein